MIALVLVLTTARCSGCSGGDSLAQVPTGLVVSPATLTFEATPAGLTRVATLEITNTGGAPLKRLAVQVLGDGFAIASAPPAVIAPGQTHQVTVAFSPRGEGEAHGTASASAIGVATASVALRGVGGEALDCGDDNPCTTDTPQLDGSCTHEPINGACDDGNACTRSEVCVEARCLGEAVACTPPASCFVGLCDTDDGCVFVTDPAACDDRDPCTIDTCTNSGCAHVTAENGMPCGSFTQCVSVHVCVLGSCLEAAVPQDTPCSDGDLCTEGDRCVASMCSGAPVVRPADLVAFAPTFGGAGSIGAILGDGRVVILDPLDDGRGALVTVLVRDGDQIRRFAEELRPDLTGLSRGSIIATSTAAQVAVLDDAGGLTIFDVDMAGRLVRRGSTPALQQPSVGRSKLVTLGETWYACPLGGHDLVVIDARDPSAPRVIGRSGLPGLCSDLAMDRANDAVIIATGMSNRPDTRAGFYRIARPFPSPVEFYPLAGRSPRIATNGRLIAAGDAGPFGRTSTVTLLDAADPRSVLGAFDAGGGSFFDEIADLAFAGDRLFVQAKTGLSVWDVSVPVAPVRLFSVDRSGVRHASTSPPAHALVTDGVTLYRAGDLVYGGLPLLLDVRGSGARTLDHPTRGGVHRMAQHANVLYGLDRTSVHAIDTTDQDRPQFLHGSTVPLDADATLWSVGAAVSPPRMFVAATQPGIYTSAYRALWRDGSNPVAPLALTAEFTPFSGGVLHVEDDGHRALAVAVSSSGDRAHLRTWDLDALSPASIQTAFASSGALELTRDPIDKHRGTIAFDDDRALAVVVDPIADLFDPGERVTSHLFVADLTSFPLATLEARATTVGHVVSAAVRGDRLILVMKVSGSLCCGWFLGEVVRTYRVSGASLTLEGEVPLPESWRVLHATASTAVISTRRGAAFVSLSPPGPRVTGEVGLPEPPVSAVAVGERLWLAGPHGISAVRPPCP